MKVFFDSSVLVASLVAKHPPHTRAISAVARAVRGQDAAHRLVKENLLACCAVVTLTAAEYEAVS